MQPPGQGWRGLLSRLAARRAALEDRPPKPPAADVFARPDDAPAEPPTALESALEEIEAGALEVYARFGLPTRAGHYRKAPGEDEWRFIAETLSPADRFALALEHPPEAGWRFARLQDLGGRSDRADLRAASRLLNEAARIRTARRGLLTEDHLLAAMELGAAWRALRDASAVRASRLTLLPPGRAPAAKPRPARPQGPKSRPRRDKTEKPR